MMYAGSFPHFASGFLAVLGAAALRSIVLAGVAGVLLAVFRVKNVTAAAGGLEIGVVERAGDAFVGVVAAAGAVRGAGRR